MNTNTIRDLFEVEIEELHSWVKRPYKNNFFEIVFIETGSGMQCINYNEFGYRSGNIFLLPPLNCHSFTINEPTKFYFVRFSDQYFLHKSAITADYKEWFEKISYILANYNRVPGDIITSECERHYIISAIKSIHKEHTTPNRYSSQIITSTISSILNILARCIEQKYFNLASDDNSRFNDILRYINSNLLNSEELKIPALAERFGISKRYFSEYFKRHASSNLADYIIKAKLRLAETYILHTDQSIKEVAAQLNFSDSSHLSNTFKRYYGMTIKEFRSIGGSMWRAM